MKRDSGPGLWLVPQDAQTRAGNFQEAEMGAGGRSEGANDRPFEAVSSAEKRKLVSRKKKKKGWGGVGVLGRSGTEPSPNQCPTRVAGDPRPATPASLVCPVGPVNSMAFSVQRLVSTGREDKSLLCLLPVTHCTSGVTHGHEGVGLVPLLSRDCLLCLPREIIWPYWGMCCVRDLHIP